MRPELKAEERASSDSMQSENGQVDFEHGTLAAKVEPLAAVLRDRPPAVESHPGAHEAVAFVPGRSANEGHPILPRQSLQPVLEGPPPFAGPLFPLSKLILATRRRCQQRPQDFALLLDLLAFPLGKGRFITHVGR